MKNENNLILVFSIAGIIAFFLPFFQIDLFITDISISGWNIVKSFFDLLSLGSKYSGFLGSIPTKNLDGGSIMGILVLIYFASGPILFLIKYIIILKKHIKNEEIVVKIIAPVVYFIICFIILNLLAIKEKDYFLFFKSTGLGFWISFISLVLLKKVSKNIENGSVNSSPNSMLTSIKDFFSADPVSYSNKQQTTKAEPIIPPDDYAAADASKRILHLINNTSIIFRDTKINASSFVETLLKTVMSDIELRVFTKSFSREEVKSHLRNILILCNKKNYREALAEVTKYMTPLLNRKKETQPDRQSYAKDDINSKIFDFSFDEQKESKSTAKPEYTYYCPECGAGLYSNDLFCPECGKKKVN
jgi:rubrerythrin